MNEKFSDSYVLTDKVLGKGSFGECREGYEKRTKVQVAVKIIP